MIKVFDYRCPVCGHTEERFVTQADEFRQLCPYKVADDEPNLMDKLPAGTRTHFRFADTNLKQ